jgi:hypothetical protein
MIIKWLVHVLIIENLPWVFIRLYFASFSLNSKEIFNFYLLPMW